MTMTNNYAETNIVCITHSSKNVLKLKIKLLRKNTSFSEKITEYKYYLHIYTNNLLFKSVKQKSVFVVLPN